MKDVFDDIVEFHAQFGLLAKQKGLLSDQLFAFRTRFLNEEVSELEEAHDDGNLPKALDACIDLAYVAFGTIVQMGFTADEIREAWRRVHAANLKKIRAENPTQSRRGSLFDVIKPTGWEEPDLSDLCK